MYHNILQVFNDVLLCFTMFRESRVPQVRNDRYRCIGDRAAADRLRHRDNIAGIGDNSAEIGDDAARVSDISAKVIQAKLRSKWRLE